MCATAVWIVAGSARADVNFNAANDYYAARGSSALQVVESYHLAPCQQKLRARDWVRAKAECDFILKIFRTIHRVVARRGDMRTMEVGALPPARRHLRSRGGDQSQAATTFVVQGIHYNRIKRYTTAIDRFKTALALDPNSLNAHYNLALTYVDTKQYDLANLHAQRAYALGATPEGLRNRLKQAGQWKPIEPTEPKGSGIPAPAGTAGAVR